MFSKIRKHFDAHNQEMHSTIKLIDIEERFDLAFSRFFGLYFAKIGKYFHMTPTQISIISMVIGVVGGSMLFFQFNWVLMVWASILISLAGVLDSADGQLARMTGQSSEMGRFIDGFIDNAVFGSCYIAGTAYFVQLDSMGWVMILLVLPAGILSHSFTSIIYDFYKSEFLYLIAKSEGSRVKTIEDVMNLPVAKSKMENFFRSIQIDYTKRQWSLVSRTEDMRQTYENFAFNDDTSEKFDEMYRSEFKPFLFWWALLGGSNTHRTMIMLFSIMGRFDLYLIFCLAKLIPIAILMVVQKFSDDEFHKQLEFEFATSR